MRRFISFVRHHYQDINKGLLFIVAVVILVSFFPKEGKFKYDFSKGKPWLHDYLIAPFDFAIYKSDEEIAGERETVLLDLKPYFYFDNKISDQALSNLPGSFETYWQSINGDQTYNEVFKNRNYRIAETLLDTILKTGILEVVAEIENRPPDYRIMLVRENHAEEIRLGELFTISTAYAFIRERVVQIKDVDNNFLLRLLENEISQNVKFNSELTHGERDKLLSNVSLTRGMIQEGQRIISKGELVSNEKFRVLESLKREYESQLGSSSSYLLILAGQIVLITIALIVLFVFIFIFKRDIFNENRKMLLLLIVIIMMVALTSLVINHYPAYLFLIPICLVPIISRSFFDSIIALFVHLITVIIIGFLVPNSFEFIFLQLIAGIVTIITIVRLQRRAQFFLTSILIFSTYSIIYVGLSFIHEGSLEQINITNFALFAGSAVLTLFSYPVIYLFEKIFGYVTDVTLLELSDTNRKLLRELSSKAPGTFQHSLQVANLAEEVIRTVGGNALLVRTGALYHDIGKMDMPLYFIENQVGGINPHDELTGEESARIIISHVIKGVEKAKKYKLPEVLIDFIRTHHGTRKVEFFYARYKEDNPDEQIDMEEFTYHGPIPFSKETAVLMIADSVEAASRSISYPDEQKLSNLVDKIIDGQMRDGQFENADLSLKDISTTRKILKRKLMNIYHIRIEYPE